VEEVNSPVLKVFCDEAVRRLADLLAGVVDMPKQFLELAQARGVSGLVGTTDAALMRPEQWTPDDYSKIVPKLIAGADSDGRSERTTLDLVKFVRIVAWLKGELDANPAVGVIVRGWAVNPAAIKF